MAIYGDMSCYMVSILSNDHFLNLVDPFFHLSVLVWFDLGNTTTWLGFGKGHGWVKVLSQC